MRAFLLRKRNKAVIICYRLIKENKEVMSATALYTGKSADADTYWNLLKNLSTDIKLDLIARLSNSLLDQGKKLENEHWASAFAGKWADTRSAEEIIDDIREARTSNKEIDL